MTFTKEYWINRHADANISWNTKTVHYCRNIFNHIDLPDGKVVMLGAAYSLALEVLYSKFGDKAIGMDLWNFANHPRCLERNIFDLEDFDCAFVYCDVDSFTRIGINDPCPRLTAFEWSMRNLVKGGYCITRLHGHTEQDHQRTNKLLEITKKYPVEIAELPFVYDGIETDPNAPGVPCPVDSRDDVLIKKIG